MQRRIFLAINIPAKFKKELTVKTKKWSDLPVLWTNEQNLHITVLFLGNVQDEILPLICEKTRAVASHCHSFDINLTKIVVGPNEKRPRMIWATGSDENHNFQNLVEKISQSLGYWQKRQKTVPHVTLGRIKSKKWKEKKQDVFICEKIACPVPVQSIEILESLVIDNKRQYLLIESCVLK